MKLQFDKPNVEMSEQLDEKFFSIGDYSLIFDVLRNKMYSNPILAICREISCNARDAHREANKFDLPIHIQLPNALEPFYKIKDFGPGISPDRVENIFIKYGASTKREDNIQTGGYGMGSKTPFSYTDSFAVITIHNGTRYNYNCIIDETKVGKLIALSETPTKEPNGTEIIIPVKSLDFEAFNRWTEFATRHWDVKPIIKGGTIMWEESVPALEGSNWKIMKSNGWQRSLKLIIDKIEYPVDLYALKNYADTHLINAVVGDIYLYFNNGELNLSANREQIYLDKPTQEKIKNRLLILEKEVKQKFTDKIQTCDNLWTANIVYRQELSKIFSNMSIFGTMSWNKCPLTLNYINLGCPSFMFSKGRYSRKHGTDPDKLSRSNTRSLSFQEDSVLFINDLPLKEPNSRHVKKIFDDNPKIKSVQIVCPNDKVKLDDLNKNYHLDQMNPQLLSSVTKASSRKPRGSSTNRLLLYKFDPVAFTFKHVNHASVDDDNNEKIICMLAGRQPMIGSKVTDLLLLDFVHKQKKNISIYGVDNKVPQSRLDEDFDDFIALEDYIKDEILTNKYNYLAIKVAETLSAYPGIDDYLLTDSKNIGPFIKNKDSAYLKKVEANKAVKELAQFSSVLRAYEIINGDFAEAEIKSYLKKHPELDLNLVSKTYRERYPLLNYVSTYYYKEAHQAVAEYINLIDNS